MAKYKENVKDIWFVLTDDRSDGQTYEIKPKL